MGDALQQTSRRLITRLVVAVVCFASSNLAAAPAEDAEPLEARLEIDTSEAGSSAEVLHRRIEERANLVLRQAKVLAGDPDDNAILISVHELEGDEPGYSLGFELRDGEGATIAEAIEIECRLCTETELVARVEAEVETVIATLRESVQVEPEPVASPSPTPTEPVPDTPPPAPRHKGMLVGGVSLMVVGAGMLGVGVGLAIPEPKVDEDNPLDLITTRPVGYGLIGGGIALAVTGVVLTAIAIERRRRPQWSLAPYGGPGQVGVVLGWRLR